MLHILQTTEHQDLHKCLQLLILSLVNVANVCTWLVTCNDPTYVETPPPRSENVQGICRIIRRRRQKREPLTHQLLIHLYSGHTQMTQFLVDIETTETPKLVFDKSQLCKVAKV